MLLVLSIGADRILGAFGLSEAVEAEGVPYLRVLALAAPLAAATAMFRAVYAGVGQTSVAMRMTVLVNVINIPLNYVLIFVVGWGLLGAGVGTVIAVAGRVRSVPRLAPATEAVPLSRHSSTYESRRPIEAIKSDLQALRQEIASDSCPTLCEADRTAEEYRGRVNRAM